MDKSVTHRNCAIHICKSTNINNTRGCLATKFAYEKHKQTLTQTQTNRSARIGQKEPISWGKNRKQVMIERDVHQSSENGTIRRGLRSIGASRMNMIHVFDARPCSAKTVLAFRYALINRKDVPSTATPCGLAATRALCLVAHLAPSPFPFLNFLSVSLSWIETRCCDRRLKQLSLLTY